MVSVMVPPIGTVVAGVNTRTGLMTSPARPPEVMEVKEAIAGVTMATKFPVVLVSMIAPALLVVAAAMVVDAA